MMKSAGVGMVVVVVFMVLGTPSAQGMTVSFTTSTTTSPCPTPVCALLIGCRPFTGPDGCPTCSCPDSNCDNTQCDPGQVCVMQDVECPPETTPCFPEPTCVYYDTKMPDTTTPDTTVPDTTVPITTFWCPMVTCIPECIATDSNGCTTCDCPPACGNTWCAESEHCELLPTPCYSSDSPCPPPQPVCVSTTATTTITTPTTTPPCPFVTCGPFCSYTSGPDGCPTCGCSYSTCEGMPCGQGEDCVMEDVECPGVTEQCLYPRCIPFVDTTSRTTTLTTPYLCPTPTCGPGCIFVTGSDGCLNCGCSDFTCDSMSCDYDEECVMQETLCAAVSDPCYFPRCIPNPTTIPTTTPATTIFLCPDFCSPYPDPENDGRDICGCLSHTCAVMLCGQGEHCVTEVVECPGVTEQCLYPRCIPTTDSCTGTPNTQRCGLSGIKIRWFYNSTANACQKFRHYGCTPSPNTFVSRKACEDKCKRTDPLICLAVVCEDDCYTFERRNQCPQCICPNPCKGFKCRESEECKLREVTCSEKTCHPKPFCAPKSCPEQDPCGIRCMYGLKTDKNGCQICECIEQPQA